MSVFVNIMVLVGGQGGGVIIGILSILKFFFPLAQAIA
jgi:hypothetical protein